MWETAVLWQGLAQPPCCAFTTGFFEKHKQLSPSHRHFRLFVEQFLQAVQFASVLMHESFMKNCQYAGNPVCLVFVQSKVFEGCLTAPYCQPGIKGPPVFFHNAPQHLNNLRRRTTKFFANYRSDFFQCSGTPAPVLYPGSWKECLRSTASFNIPAVIHCIKTNT